MQTEQTMLCPLKKTLFLRTNYPNALRQFPEISEFCPVACHKARKGACTQWVMIYKGVHGSRVLGFSWAAGPPMPSQTVQISVRKKTDMKMRKGKELKL